MVRSLEVGKPIKVFSFLIFFILLLVPIRGLSITVSWESSNEDQILYDHDINKTLFLKIFFDEESFNRSITILDNELVESQIFTSSSTGIANVTLALNSQGTPNGTFKVPYSVKWTQNSEEHTYNDNISVSFLRSFEIGIMSAPSFINEGPQEILFSLKVFRLLTNVTVGLEAGSGIKTAPSTQNFSELNEGTYIIRSNISSSGFLGSPIHEIAFSMAIRVNADIGNHELHYRSNPIHFETKNESNSGNLYPFFPVLVILLALLVITLMIVYYRRRTK
jgi:hypothetical protein